MNAKELKDKIVELDHKIHKLKTDREDLATYLTQIQMACGHRNAHQEAGRAVGITIAGDTPYWFICPDCCARFIKR